MSINYFVRGLATGVLISIMGYFPIERYKSLLAAEDAKILHRALEIASREDDFPQLSVEETENFLRELGVKIDAHTIREGSINYEINRLFIFKDKINVYNHGIKIGQTNREKLLSYINSKTKKEFYDRTSL